MSDERKTLNISTETYEYLASVGERRDDESADAFLFRVAEELADSDDGMDVTSCNMTDGRLDRIEKRVRSLEEQVEQSPEKTAEVFQKKYL